MPDISAAMAPPGEMIARRLMGSGREMFRYQWRGSHFHEGPVEDLWFALGEDSGEWWFDAFYIGRARLTGGAARAIAFAQCLLEEPPTGRYEKEFLLVHNEPWGRGMYWKRDGQETPLRIVNTTLEVTCLLCRDIPEGAEYLTINPSGHAPEDGVGFDICAELWSKPVDRSRLRSAATTLLTTLIDATPRP
jgi:hypothetical protein